MTSLKEKPWSVTLIEGYILNNEVRAAGCQNCKRTTRALTVNFSNPNLCLYGCSDTKCQRRLLRFDFNENTSFKPVSAKS